MKRTIITMVVASCLVGTAIYAKSLRPRPKDQPDGQQVDSAKRPKVDLVIALDTSGSMSGLINAARQKLWDIVNEVGKAKPSPMLRVGLVTYGSGGTEQDGYVIVRQNLTTDLDTIYSRLFELTTSGGTEYVGRVVHRATRELSWDQDQRTLKQIFVAGNESADQDRTVSASQAVRAARKRGIFVNAIYCGPQSAGDALSWRTVASGGNGVFASIDHNHGTVAIATPYDRKINALSARLNRTYVGYGRHRREGARRQKAQDANAARVHSSAAASRALAKVSGVYRNDKWDLVDARKAGKLAEVAKRPSAMPAELRGLGTRKLNAYLDKKEAERREIRKQIVALSKKRKAHISAEMKRKGKTEDQAFDGAVRRAVRVQAAAKGIRL